MIGGPFFEDLAIGQVYDQVPGVTLTPGLAAAHQLIVGDRLALSLDAELAGQVLGTSQAMAHPALVWDLAIGHSTLATQRVIANLFYRGLAFHRLPVLGDTLCSRTAVVALRQNRSRPTGLAVLRTTTTDQLDRVVLDFWRCAMLPLRDEQVDTGWHDELGPVGAQVSRPALVGVASGLNLQPFQDRIGAGAALDLGAGSEWETASGDVVSSAPELARLTLNIAAVHHDRFAQPGGRLVYGGHVVDIATAQLCRLMPRIVTVLAWGKCDHLGPVREGDTLFSSVQVTRVEPVPGGALVDLRVQVSARGEEVDPPIRPVADWEPIVLAA